MEHADTFRQLGNTFATCSAYWKVMATFDKENAATYTNLEKKFLIAAVASAKSVGDDDLEVRLHYQNETQRFYENFQGYSSSKADVAKNVLSTGKLCTEQLAVINKLSEMLRDKLNK